MKRDFKTFFGGTVADWVRCELPYRPPDHISYAGSAYWDFKTHVRRLSDHWGKLRSSRWLLEGNYSSVFTCAKCYYSDFRSIRCLSDEEIEDLI